MLSIPPKSAATFEPTASGGKTTWPYTLRSTMSVQQSNKAKRRKTHCSNKSNERHSCHHFISLKLEEGMTVEEIFLFSFKMISGFKGGSVRSVLM
jgi:hypothetical protein